MRRGRRSVCWTRGRPCGLQIFRTDRAQLYTGKSRQNLCVDAAFLSETQPGRLTRPIVEPTVAAEEAGEISIHIWKERRDLELLSDGEVIATYSIGLGGWPWDTKIAQGDSRTPGGQLLRLCAQCKQPFLPVSGPVPSQQGGRRQRL